MLIAMLYNFCLIFVIFILKQTNCLQINRTNNDGCASEPLCLKCGKKGCIKCPNLIIFSTRKCVTKCPYGYYKKWSTKLDYMGQLCIENNNLFGLSNEILSILIGILIGLFLSIILIVLLIIFIKYKRRRCCRQNLLIKNNNLTRILDTNSDDFDDNSSERKDFNKQLELLKPYAQIYLDMLNDTRKQLRELHNLGDNNALTIYKPIVRDLARILLLLNRKIGDYYYIIPNDWDYLFNWSIKLLKRYKRMNYEIENENKMKSKQLIDFLQNNDNNTTTTTIMSTFKPEQKLLNSSTISLNTNHLQPQWKFEYSIIDDSSQSTTNTYPLNLWKNNSKEYLNSSLFLDDDFCQLGFRPQDEITTEL